MRSTALALVALLVFGAAIPVYVHAQADIEIEEAPSDEGMDDLGTTRPGQKRKPEEPAKVYGTKGFYGIIAGTYAAEDLTETKQDIENEVFDKVDFSNSLGFNIRGGYRVHPNLATELQFEWLDEFELENTAAAEASVEGVWSLTANAKGFISTGRFQPFIIVGLGYYDVGDTSQSGTTEALPDDGAFGVRAGGGFDYFLTDNIALDLEATYNFATDQLDDLRYLSFSWGLMFKF
jgi:opacity protein-like surface antigen